MLFMVIESFRDNDMVAVYQRLREGGRSLGDGHDFESHAAAAPLGNSEPTSAETRAVVQPYLEPPADRPEAPGAGS